MARSAAVAALAGAAIAVGTLDAAGQQPTASVDFEVRDIDGSEREVQAPNATIVVRSRRYVPPPEQPPRPPPQVPPFRPFPPFDSPQPPEPTPEPPPEPTPEPLRVAVPFKLGTASPYRGTHQAIERAAREIERLGLLQVALAGHADERGTPRLNQRLSWRRARTARRLLRRRLATAAPRMRLHGYGEARPVAPNIRPDGSDDPDGRRRNRRVEIIEIP